MTLDRTQLAYLTSQPLGRLATVHPTTGMPHNSPVAFTYNEATGTIDIGGYAMGGTRKFANVEATGKASLVVDDIASYDPWEVRGVEIRGRAEAIRDVEPSTAYLSREIIRLHPTRVIGWGLADAESEA